METLIEEDTRYKKQCTQDNEASVPFQSRSLGSSHSSASHHQLPCHIFLNLIDGLKSLSLQRAFYFWEGPEITRPKSELLGAESPRWFDILPKNLCTRCDAWAGKLLKWSCQSPVVHNCSLLNHLNSFHGSMFKLKAKSDADSLLYSFSNFWMKQQYSTHAHSTASTIPSN